MTDEPDDDRSDQHRITRRRLLEALSAGAVISSVAPVGPAFAQPGITNYPTWDLDDLYPDR